MRAVFIRHGQSTGNAGVPCHDLASIELTELGWRQAREVARAWTETPSLIVTSPYLRARQTAEATIQRLATCSMGSSSARRSISALEFTECFCSAVSESGAQKRVFSSASSGSGS
mgnify:CR=1 FL=1